MYYPCLILYNLYSDISVARMKNILPIVNSELFIQQCVLQHINLDINWIIQTFQRALWRPTHSDRKLFTGFINAAFTTW